jgi:hypothetical protein
VLLALLVGNPLWTGTGVEDIAYAVLGRAPKD